MYTKREYDMFVNKKLATQHLAFKDLGSDGHFDSAQ